MIEFKFIKIFKEISKLNCSFYTYYVSCDSLHVNNQSKEEQIADAESLAVPERQQWDSQWEFLMSCISMVNCTVYNLNGNYRFQFKVKI